MPLHSPHPASSCGLPRTPDDCVAGGPPFRRMRGPPRPLSSSHCPPPPLHPSAHAAAFAPATACRAPQVAAGHLDDDGLVDFLVQSVSTGAVSWLHVPVGSAASDPATPLTLYPRATIPAEVPSEVDLADVDGDGRLDVVLTLRSAGQVRWLRNAFDPAAPSPVEALPFPAEGALLWDLPGSAPSGVVVVGGSDGAAADCLLAATVGGRQVLVAVAGTGALRLKLPRAACAEGTSTALLSPPALRPFCPLTAWLSSTVACSHALCPCRPTAPIVSQLHAPLYTCRCVLLFACLCMRTAGAEWAVVANLTEVGVSGVGVAVAVGDLHGDGQLDCVVSVQAAPSVGSGSIVEYGNVTTSAGVCVCDVCGGWWARRGQALREALPLLHSAPTRWLCKGLHLLPPVPSLASCPHSPPLLPQGGWCALRGRLRRSCRPWTRRPPRGTCSWWTSTATVGWTWWPWWAAAPRWCGTSWAAEGRLRGS